MLQDDDDVMGKALSVYSDNSQTDGYDELSTDELLERLPNNLHLARNDNAPDDDRWRIFNSHTQKYCEPGKGTPREIMLYTLRRIDSQLQSWTGRSESNACHQPQIWSE